MKRLAWLPLAVLLASVPARAADDPAKLEQAKTFFSAGAQAYDAGRFGAAIQAFEQAYAIAPKPQILFSLAQAERKSWFVDKRPEDLKGAIAHYHAYLDQVPTGGRRGDAADALAELEPIESRLEPPPAAAPAQPPPAPPEPKTRLMVMSPTAGARASLDGGPASDVPLIDDVKPGRHRVRVSAEGFFDEERDALAASGSLAAIDVPLREKPALLAVQLDASASLSVDGRPLATTPLARPLELAAGTHLVSISRNGSKAFAREVVLERGKQTQLGVSLESSGQRKAAWIALAAGGASALAGAVLTTAAYVEQSNAQSVVDAQKAHNIQQGDVETYRSSLDARDRWRTAAIVSFGAAAGLAAIGGVLFLFDKPSVEAPPPAMEPATKPKGPEKNDRSLEVGATPWIAPAGAGAAIGGRF